MGTPYTSADKTDENKYLYKKGTAYLTTEDGKTLAYLLKTDAETFEIPKDIEKVSDGAFVRLTALKSITVAEGNANYTYDASITAEHPDWSPYKLNGTIEDLIASRKCHGGCSLCIRR